MSEPTFAAHVGTEGGAGLVELAGRVDRTAGGSLEDAFRRAATHETVVLDFSAVEFINSTGIALIVGLVQQARTAGVDMAACGLSDHFREIFEITRIVDYLPVYDDRRAALDAGLREKE